ncbi:hypothetical protein MTR67_022007 [Solanum verrucosum]|uniref:Uncharacterized protein n=1 Tax=Solanum verrucosum TaxID=315347 RepID=A0AAF0QTZ5_SOLVR|nr:hypothetical protein MTR67_022007 [Solanum verrucosum]
MRVVSDMEGSETLKPDFKFRIGAAVSPFLKDFDGIIPAYTLICRDRGFGVVKMAEASSSRITITLGRSGQVVKKAGPVLDHPFPDSGPAVGNKRSVRDRLGSIADSTTEFNNKR